jgi:hypothetical protein
VTSDFQSQLTIIVNRNFAKQVFQCALLSVRDSEKAQKIKSRFCFLKSTHCADLDWDYDEARANRHDLI